MYQSTLRLNRRNPNARKELKDVFELNRTIKSAFPDGGGSVLFLVDQKKSMIGHRERTVYVLSENRPDWSFLSLYSEYLAADPRCSEFNTDFTEGQFLDFRLLANPAPDVGANRPMSCPELQEAWLKREASRGGFSITVMQWSQRGPCAVLYEGTLRVKDPEKFKDTLRDGVGGDVSFGLGMLMILRSHRT